MTIAAKATKQMTLPLSERQEGIHEKPMWSPNRNRTISTILSEVFSLVIILIIFKFNRRRTIMSFIPHSSYSNYLRNYTRLISYSKKGFVKLWIQCSGQLFWYSVVTKHGFRETAPSLYDKFVCVYVFVYLEI